MTTLFTKERLQEIAEDGFLKHGESKLLARVTLAAMDAEPVYQWRERYEEGSLWEDCTKEQYDGFAEHPECEVRVLYPAPPVPFNDITHGKLLTITMPDISSKAFWSGTGKSEVFHPETYKRWVKEAIERACAIAKIEARVK